MTFLAVLPDQLTGPISLVLLLAGGAPEPEDVKAGWTAFAIFLLLAVAVAFLGLSLVQAAPQGPGRPGRRRVRRRPARRADERTATRPTSAPSRPGSDDGEPHRS